MPSQPSIPTRSSLLDRLRDGDDVDGWMEFYRMYADLIRSFARKHGLTESEAEEVVQETAIGVARNLPGFRYDPSQCSFKTWMLNLTRWRIMDALRRRGRLPSPLSPAVPQKSGSQPNNDTDPSTMTPWIERIPDSNLPNAGADWDAHWEHSLRQAALERVRNAIDLRHFQIFDLYALKNVPAREVAHRVGVHVAQVYLVKQRVSARWKKEILRLSTGAGRARDLCAGNRGSPDVPVRTAHGR